MTTFAISMVRDEADIIGATVAHMLGQVDHVIVADNGSTDDTRAILSDLGVEVVDDPDPAYYQSRKMTALAQRAAAAGATWVVPFDADEIWCAADGRIADLLAASTVDVVTAALYDHVPSALDPDVADPVRRIGWRRATPTPLPKVACRVAPDLVIAQGNHAATYDRPHVEVAGLVVHHYPYRSADQFVRKARNGSQAYRATDLPDTAGAHWRQYGDLLDAHGPEVLAGVFRRWFWSPDPTADGLVWDPAL
jgi:glycosyltransferase involved in cell wall biosynthesis